MTSLDELATAGCEHFARALVTCHLHRGFAIVVIAARVVMYHATCEPKLHAHGGGQTGARGG